MTLRRGFEGRVGAKVMLERSQERTEKEKMGFGT